MPNHCSQDLFVSGPVDQLEEFIEFSKDSDEQGNKSLSHNKYIPYPQHFKEMDRVAEEARKRGDNWSKIPKDGFNSGGYEWCCEHWGTKWGIYSDQLEYKKPTGKAKYTFESAWSPASKIILAMSKRFPKLNFVLKYYERGAAYKGIYEVKGGQVIRDVLDRNYRGNRGG